ncbi:MAG: hypothetical protein E6Q97_37510 [Desulfurellales bacterium]|nr:MAG: hypothetical protein E6Q97_37510 [Desulfurellales bacterium]
MRILILLLVATAAACGPAPALPVRGGEITTNTAASLATTVSTGWINTQGYRFLKWTVAFTRQASGNLTFKCYENETGTGAVASQLQGCDSVTDAVCTLQDASWVKAVTASVTYPILVDVTGMKYVQCTLTHSAPTTDTVTLKYAKGVM